MAYIYLDGTTHWDRNTANPLWNLRNLQNASIFKGRQVFLDKYYKVRNSILGIKTVLRSYQEIRAQALINWETDQETSGSGPWDTVCPSEQSSFSTFAPWPLISSLFHQIIQCPLTCRNSEHINPQTQRGHLNVEFLSLEPSEAFPTATICC